MKTAAVGVGRRSRQQRHIGNQLKEVFDLVGNKYATHVLFERKISTPRGHIDTGFVDRSIRRSAESSRSSSSRFMVQRESVLQGRLTKSFKSVVQSLRKSGRYSRQEMIDIDGDVRAL